MSVSGSAPIDARAQAAAVGQLHGDPLGAVDDVVVGEDAAVGVDDEAAAGAAPGRVAIGSRAAVVGAVEEVRRIGVAVAAPPIAPAARRVDVDDGRVDALDDVGEIRPSDAEAAGAAGARPRRVAAGFAACRRPSTERLTPPATIAPTRNATTAVSASVTRVNRRDISYRASL